MVEQVTIAVFHIIEVHFCFGSCELFLSSGCETQKCDGLTKEQSVKIKIFNADKN